MTEKQTTINVQLAVARQPFSSHDRQTYRLAESYLTVLETGETVLVRAETREARQVAASEIRLTRRTAERLRDRLSEYLEASKPLNESTGVWSAPMSDDEWSLASGKKDDDGEAATSEEDTG